jgi:2-isopropylmalate synthase
MRTIRVLDTTLRDGLLTPGVQLGVAKRVEIALALDAAGVDVLEVAFPARGADDRAALSAVAEVVERATIAALARAETGDIDVAARLLERAARARLHLFAGGSTRQERAVVESTARAVAHARSVAPTLELQLSAVDSTRCERAFLTELACAAAEVGATTIGLTDTLGVALPPDVAGLVAHLRAALPAPVTLSFHGHDDLGLATAGTLAALVAGADQIETCVNGLGPRAGNTPLEEIVAIVAAHGPRLGLATGVDRSRLAALCALVAEHTGVSIAAAKAIVGAHATPADLDGIVGR